MKYLWTHAVCRTDFSRNQLLCPKTVATFPLSRDFLSRARLRNRPSFTDVHFWTCKYMRGKTNVRRFCSSITQIGFLWFLKFVSLNVCSISWTLSLNTCLRRFTLECGLIFLSTGWLSRLFTIYKKNPEILVGTFRSVRTVRVVHHFLNFLDCRATLDWILVTTCN